MLVRCVKRKVGLKRTIISKPLQECSLNVGRLIKQKLKKRALATTIEQVALWG
jgi:hypothetical protein